MVPVRSGAQHRLLTPFWGAAWTTVIPGNFSESLLNYLYMAEERDLHRSASSTTHCLLPSSHSVSPPDSECWGYKGPQKSFSPFVLLNKPERSRNCQDCSPPAQCPLHVPVWPAGHQIRLLSSVKQRPSHRTRKLPMNPHWKCQVWPQIIQEVPGNLRKQGRSMLGLCGQVSMVLQLTLLLAHCKRDHGQPFPTSLQRGPAPISTSIWLSRPSLL